jgi:hypothetical protein
MINNFKLADLERRISGIESGRDSVEDVTDEMLPLAPRVEPSKLDYPAAIILDSNPVVSDATRRYTVELNPDAGTHTNELQLRNVGTVPVSSERFPKFVTDASGGGDLEWVDLSAEIEPAEPWTNMYVITQGATPSVSFTAGDVSWGSKRATVTGTAGGNITNNNWWGIKVTPDGGGIAAEWVEKATLAEFTSGEDATSIEYYQFKIVGGIASIKAIAAKGNWKIPSVFAPE